MQSDLRAASVISKQGGREVSSSQDHPNCSIVLDPSDQRLRKLEFSEGDIGIAGGLQVLEPASANPVTTDSIKSRSEFEHRTAELNSKSNQRELSDGMKQQLKRLRLRCRQVRQYNIFVAL